MATGQSKKSGGAKKIGRDVEKCKRYGFRDTREVRKVKKITRNAKRIFDSMSRRGTIPKDEKVYLLFRRIVEKNTAAHWTATKEGRVVRK